MFFKKFSIFQIYFKTLDTEKSTAMNEFIHSMLSHSFLEF